MRRRLLVRSVAVGVALGSFFVLTVGSADASSVRDRIMAKRQALGGRWDCASGTGCSLSGSQRSAPMARAVTAARPAAAPAPAVERAPTGGPRRIEISIAQQRLQLLEGNRVLLSTSVSTGTASYPTPTGDFSILSKERMHWSTQYDVWMPYAMRVVAGVFIHEVAIAPDGSRLGVSSIGGPASHGCIRVPIGTAARLYSLSHVAMPVHIR